MIYMLNLASRDEIDIKKVEHTGEEKDVHAFS